MRLVGSSVAEVICMKNEELRIQWGVWAQEN